MYKSDDVREVLSTKRGERQTPRQQDRLSSSKIRDGREPTNKAKKELLWAVECRWGHLWGKRITTAAAAAVTTAKEGRRGGGGGERRGRERRRREGSVELWRGVKRNGGKGRGKKEEERRGRKKEKGGRGERE